MKYTFRIFIMLLLGSSLFAQKSNQDDIVFKAMNDELDRNLKNIVLENLKRPFYIAYNYYDVKKISIKAELGMVVKSESSAYNQSAAVVHIGDYQMNDRNFVSSDYTSIGDYNGSFPLTPDYFGIRNGFWIETDKAYKRAADTYEKKIVAITQQNISKEKLELADLVKIPVVNKRYDNKGVNLSLPYWENISKELSGVFKNYPDIISSEVNVNVYQINFYYVNSEGITLLLPANIIGIQSNAYTQTEDGDPVADYVSYYGITETDFPELSLMKKEVKEMAEMILKMKVASKMPESYSGPVIFEGQAVAEIFLNKFFNQQTGLYAKREPIYADASAARWDDDKKKPLEEYMGRKVLANNLSVKLNPRQNKAGDKNLIGTYNIDAEGVEPSEEHILIDKGILKSLINNRVPSKKISKPSGNILISVGGWIERKDFSPGVVTVEAEERMSYTDLKAKLLKAAKDEGLDYAIIVRKIEDKMSGTHHRFGGSVSMFGGDAEMPFPLHVYKVDLNTGKEELLRTAKLSDISMSTFKRLQGVSNKDFVYNTAFSSEDNFSNTMKGSSCSIIMPDAILFDEIEVSPYNPSVSVKLPIVSNPLNGN